MAIFEVEVFKDKKLLLPWLGVCRECRQSMDVGLNCPTPYSQPTYAHGFVLRGIARGGKRTGGWGGQGQSICKVTPQALQK